MSERIWDGRGEALEDARLTTADGRMADDLRLKGLHFRVMAHIGRQNHRRGWLRVSQTELAERWACHRVALNRAFKQLVEWGYLMQRTQEEAGESFCLYKVALDGETDESATPAKQAKKPPSGVQPTGYTPPDGGCNVQVTPVQPTDYTCVAGEVTPPSAPYISSRAHRLSPTIADSSPPPPQGGERVRKGNDRNGVKRERPRGRERPGDGWASGWSDAARDAVDEMRLNVSTSHVATALIDVVCGTLRPQKGADAEAFVRQVSSRLRRFSPEVLGRTAARLLDERSGGYLPAAPDIERLAEAFAGVPSGGSPGAGVVVSHKCHPRQAAAWARYAEAHGSASRELRHVGRMLRDHGSALVPTEWPPSATETHKDAAA